MTRRLADLSLLHSGIGTTILQPQAPTWRICATISFFKFHGKISR